MAAAISHGLKGGGASGASIGGQPAEPFGVGLFVALLEDLSLARADIRRRPHVAVVVDHKQPVERHLNA